MLIDYMNFFFRNLLFRLREFFSISFVGGKENEELNIPLNSSLSVTLHADDVSVGERKFYIFFTFANAGCLSYVLNEISSVMAVMH